MYVYVHSISLHISRLKFSWGAEEARADDTGGAAANAHSEATTETPKLVPTWMHTMHRFIPYTHVCAHIKPAKTATFGGTRWPTPISGTPRGSVFNQPFFLAM